MTCIKVTTQPPDVAEVGSQRFVLSPDLPGGGSRRPVGCLLGIAAPSTVQSATILCQMGPHSTACLWDLGRLGNLSGVPDLGYLRYLCDLPRVRAFVPCCCCCCCSLQPLARCGQAALEGVVGGRQGCDGFGASCVLFPGASVAWQSVSALQQGRTSQQICSLGKACSLPEDTDLQRYVGQFGRLPGALLTSPLAVR